MPRSTECRACASRHGCTWRRAAASSVCWTQPGMQCLPAMRQVLLSTRLLLLKWQCGRASGVLQHSSQLTRLPFPPGAAAMQVFVQYTDPSTKELVVLTGDVLITKNPCFHSGDIHALKVGAWGGGRVGRWPPVGGLGGLPSRLPAEHWPQPSLPLPHPCRRWTAHSCATCLASWCSHSRASGPCPTRWAARGSPGKGMVCRRLSRLLSSASCPQ